MSERQAYRRIAALKTVAQFRSYLGEIGADIPFEEPVENGPEAPLAQPLNKYGLKVGNRFCVQPLEGWDGTDDGRPTELTIRRWRRFGASGAKLIWGGEAVAVNHQGRSNPQQLLLNEGTCSRLAMLRQELVAAHQAEHTQTDDLFIGLQLTHSGRFARPDQDRGPQPRILYHHPLLNARFKLPDDYPLLTDDEIKIIIDDFVHAAVLAQQAGFDFVDIKHCHGYLGHEFLSAYYRTGPYGGSFENRTRFLREVVAGIRARAPGLGLGVRLSAFDWVPFRAGEDGRGHRVARGRYRYAFGGDGYGTGIDLTEPVAFLTLLEELDIHLVNITLGSSYTVPHILRPALFSAPDGYESPEEPLLGVARHIAVTAELKRQFKGMIFVGSGYSYLQEWLPNVAQRVVRQGMADFVGLGRMMLSYPQMPADVLLGRPLRRKQICRSFSDCTTAPRYGLISGCYPLDEQYRNAPQAEQLRQVKRANEEPA